MRRNFLLISGSCAPGLLARRFSSLSTRRRPKAMGIFGSRSSSGVAQPNPQPPEAVTSERNGLRQLFRILYKLSPEDTVVPEDVLNQELLPAMHNVRYSDLGIEKPSNSLSELASMSLHDAKQASLCCFFIPPGKTLPLHDHPGMDVVLKVLFGSVRIQGFDWVNPEKVLKGVSLGEPALPHFARQVYNKHFEENEVLRLQPASGGVLHQISCDGQTLAGFLDCITPPYNTHPQPGELPRNCTYFSAVPFTEVNLEALPDHLKAEIPDAKSDLFLLTPRTNFHGAPMIGYRAPSLPWMH
ncbi:hypothetical protein DIPPA_56409 [Diplonema papillatum]|nr:hypothetical protein DIPPA_56409 [Diplonema papillatum]